MIAATIIVIALGTLLLMTVSGDVQYSDDGLQISGKIGPFQIPQRKRDAGTERAGKVKSGKAKSEDDAEKISERKLSFAKLMQYKALAFDTLGRLRRMLSIDYFSVYFTAASGDPYHTAIQFGTANAVLGVFTAVLCRGFNVRECDIKTRLDYSITAPVICVRIKVSIACWELIYIISALGADILNSKYRNR